MGVVWERACVGDWTLIQLQNIILIRIFVLGVLIRVIGKVPEFYVGLALRVGREEVLSAEAPVEAGESLLGLLILLLPDIASCNAILTRGGTIILVTTGRIDLFRRLHAKYLVRLP